MHFSLLTAAAVASIALVSCGRQQETSKGVMRTLPVESVTVEGILVDTWCYSQEGANGSGRWPPAIDTACSDRSMQLGYPVAVVVDRDSVWVLSEAPRIFSKFLNDSVRVSGDIRSEGVLIPRSFDRLLNDTWQKIF